MKPAPAPHVPAGWATTEIAQLFAPLEDGRTLHQGWSPQCEKGPSQTDADWGVLKTTAIQRGTFLPEHNKRLPDELQARPLIEVKPGDILITCAGPRARCGVACLVRTTRPRLMMSGKMYRFRVRSDHVDPRFIEAYLQSTRAAAAIDQMKTGGSDSGLNLTHTRFRGLRVPLAPLAEQRRIVAAIDEQFSRLDAVESILQRTRVRLAQLRRAVYALAVAGAWPEVPLEKLLREPLRNGHSAKASRDGTGVRTLTLTAVTKGDFSDANTKITTASPERVGHLWLEPGDVLIERSNTPDLVGTAALFRGEREWAIFPDLVIRVRVSDDLLPEFLELVLKAESTRRYFRSAAQGIAGSMPKIDQGTVERLPVPLPSTEEQVSIVAHLQRQILLVDRMSGSVEGSLRRSAGLRHSILDRAFSGTLVRQDPADEPAVALLERIALAQPRTPTASSSKRVSA